jgi:hypothetical protein
VTGAGRGATGGGAAGAAPRGWERADWAWLGAVVATAVAVRGLYLSEVAGGPLFLLNGLPETDMHGFDRWARRIAAGEWVGRGAFYQAPLYPYVLGLLYALAGPGWLAGLAANQIFGALTCAALFQLGRALFDRRVGIACGALWALYAPAVFYEGFLLSTALETLLAATFALALTRASDRAGPGATGWFLAGLAGGLAAAARPNFLVALPGALVLLGHGSPRPPGRRALAKAAAYVAGAAAIVGPITLRNLVVGGAFVVISSSGPVTFRIGNSFDSVPIGFTYPEREAMPVTSGAFWSHQAVKLVFFWYGLEPAQNANYHLGRRFSRGLSWAPVEFWAVAPLGLAGMVRSARAGRRVLPLHLVFWPYALSVVAFFVVARFRLPAVAVLLPFAGAGGAWIWDAAGAGRRGQALALAAAVLAVGLALRPWGTRLRSDEDLADLRAKGARPLRLLGHGLVRAQDIANLRVVTEREVVRLTAEGDPARLQVARGLVERYLAALPGDAYMIGLRGFVVAHLGDHAAAEREYRRALAADDALAIVHYHLGHLYRARDPDGRRACPHLARARALDPRGEQFPGLGTTLAELGCRR